MASVSYPSVLLLDDVNNPISPLVDIDSIYEDVSTKESVSVLSKLATSKISEAEKDKIVCNETTGYITINDNQFDASTIVSIVTDVSIGAPVVVGNVSYPSHTLKIQKVDLNQLLTVWYEQEYMRNQLGFEVWYGNSPYKPTSFSKASNTEDTVVTFEGGSQKRVGDLTHKIDGETIKNKLYRINDYNSTNFLTTDDGKYPRRGKVYPSGEYIWFLILNTKNTESVIPTTIHLYGASGEDSPQEIELTRVADSGGSFLYHSTSTFGIDSELNGNAKYNDGYEYNIYLKYKTQKNV